MSVRKLRWALLKHILGAEVLNNRATSVHSLVGPCQTIKSGEAVTSLHLVCHCSQHKDQIGAWSQSVLVDDGGRRCTTLFPRVSQVDSNRFPVIGEFDFLHWP